MSGNDIIDDTEADLRTLATRWTAVAERECLLCYVHRMLEFGCDNQLRWARLFRDQRAPRATRLEDRLGQVGGYCDCEIFLNGFALAPDLWKRPGPFEVDGVVFQEDPSYPDPFPQCGGVRLGSTRGCDLWVRRRGGW
jgi:hypothetical protein